MQHQRDEPRRARSSRRVDKRFRGKGHTFLPTPHDQVGLSPTRPNSPAVPSSSGVERLPQVRGLRGRASITPDGYAVSPLVELDRRFGLNGGIFFLTPADLKDLTGTRPFRLDRPEADSGRRN